MSAISPTTVKQNKIAELKQKIAAKKKLSEQQELQTLNQPQQTSFPPSAPNQPRAGPPKRTGGIIGMSEADRIAMGKTSAPVFGGGVPPSVPKKRFGIVGMSEEDRLAMRKTSAPSFAGGGGGGGGGGQSFTAVKVKTQPKPQPPSEDENSVNSNDFISDNDSDDDDVNYVAPPPHSFTPTPPSTSTSGNKIIQMLPPSLRQEATEISLGTRKVQDDNEIKQSMVVADGVYNPNDIGGDVASAKSVVGTCKVSVMRRASEASQQHYTLYTFTLVVTGATPCTSCD